MQSRAHVISEAHLQLRSVDIMLAFLRTCAATRHIRSEQLDLERLTQLRQRAGHYLADFEGTPRGTRRTSRPGLEASLRELRLDVDDFALRYAAHSVAERPQPLGDLSERYRPVV